MGILGDIEDFGSALVDGVTGDSSQPRFAPVPTPDGGPPGPVEPIHAAMPDASGSGQITVHRDVLRKIAGALHSHVAELDSAIQRVQNAGGRLSSLSGWSTGSAFGGNVQSACTGFGKVGAHTSNMQSNAARNLTDSALHYEDKESEITHKINSGPSAMLNASTGSISSAGRI